ncbi:MAG: SPOR domain-containing protein [Pseudomonadota bacterium]
MRRRPAPDDRFAPLYPALLVALLTGCQTTAAPEPGAEAPSEPGILATASTASETAETDDTATGETTPDSEPEENTAEMIGLLEASYRGSVDERLEPAPEAFLAWADLSWRDQPTLPGIWIRHPRATTSARVRIVDPDSGRAADGALVPAVGLQAPMLSQAAGRALALRPFGKQRLLIVAIAPPDPLLVIPDIDEPTATTAVAAATPEVGGDPETPSTQAVADDAVLADDIDAEGTDEEPTISLAALPAETATAEGDAAAPDTAISDVIDDGSGTDLAATTQNDFPQTASASPVETSPSPDPTRVAAAEPTIVADGAPGTGVTAGVTAGEAAQARIAATVRQALSGEAEATPAPGPIEIEPETPAPAEPEPEPETTAAAADTTLSDSTPLARPFVQGGVFRLRDNARNVVSGLLDAGIPAAALETTAGGDPAWRVRVGPFTDRAARSAAIRELRALGVPDAIPSRR